MTLYEETIVADIVAGDSFASGFGYDLNFSAAIILGDSLPTPFNFTEWQRENLAIASSAYKATLEQADGTVLLTLNLKNFQAKLNLNYKHYLSVVCANADDFDSIETWIAAGTVFAVVRKVLLVNGVESVSEIIARVECDTPRLDKGASSASVTLSGYWAESFSAKNVTLTCPKIKRSVGGKLVLTFPEPDLYLRPGDTVSVPEEVDFVVGSVSYTVSNNISMTISEEAEV